MVGDPINIYTTSLTPTSAALEAVWQSTWAPGSLTDQGPYLFSELEFSAFTNPTVVKLYVRGNRGRWGLVPDGAVTLTAMDPSDGVYVARHLVGNGCTGFVWVSDHAGTAVCSRSRVV